MPLSTIASTPAILEERMPAITWGPTGTTNPRFLLAPYRLLAQTCQNEATIVTGGLPFDNASSPPYKPNTIITLVPRFPAAVSRLHQGIHPPRRYGPIFLVLHIVY